MTVLSGQRWGAVALVLGSLLLAVYAALFPILLPVGSGSFDYSQVVLSRGWVGLTLVAFVGVLLMMAGFHAVYSRLRSEAGFLGAIGFLFVQAAFLLQACKISWELFLDPIIAAHPESAFLLRDGVIANDPAVMTFLVVSAIFIVIGIVLFCLTLYRSDEYPKAAAILIFVGALVYATGPMVSVFVSVVGVFTLSLGCLFVGLRLWRAQPVT